MTMPDRRRDSTHPLTVLVHDHGLKELSDVVKLDRYPRTRGGYADIYWGEVCHSDAAGTTAVAAKHFRVDLRQDAAFCRTVTREIQIWSGLHHENILPLLGFVDLSGDLCLVSSWMENGTLSEYLQMHPTTDLIPLAEGIASGMQYLHANGVVHSDLKSANILISEAGLPLLSDFGVSRLHMDSRTVTGTRTLKGSARWMAIELLDSSERISTHQMHTKKSDVWAFGMVLYELLTRTVPYLHLSNDALVVLAIVRYELPKEPADIMLRPVHEQNLWRICQSCWAKTPSDRPSMEAISNNLFLPKGDKVSLSFEKELGLQSGYVTMVLFTPEGNHIVSCSQNKGNIYTWDIQTGEMAAEPIYGGGRLATFSSNRRFATVLQDKGTAGVKGRSLRDDVVGISDLHAGATRSAMDPVISHPGMVQCIAFSPNGEDILTGGKYDLRIWDATTGAMLGQILNGACSVAFSPCGQFIVTASESGILRVLDAHTGIAIRERDSLSYITSVAYSPDGRCIAVASRCLAIEDALSGVLLKLIILQEHAYITCFAYSPDGRFLVIGDGNGDLSVWDALTCQCVCGPDRYHASNITCVAFSPDGKYVASVAANCYSTVLWRLGE